MKKLIGLLLIACFSTSVLASNKEKAIKEFIQSSFAMREEMNEQFIADRVPLADQIKIFDEMDSRIYEGLTQLRSMSDEEFDAYLADSGLVAECSGVVTFFAFTKTMFHAIAAPTSEFDGMGPIKVLALKIGALIVGGPFMLGADLILLPANIWHNAVSLAEENEICDQGDVLSL